MTDQPHRRGSVGGIGNLRTTAEVIKQTTASFTGPNNLFTFLFLSLILFSFRTFVENGTDLLTTFIDRDPSLKSLLSRLDLAARPHHQHHLHPVDGRLPHHHHPHHRHRRRPFLHLTRVGTLDDDFFSGDDDSDRSLFGPIPKPPLNGTSVILHKFDPNSGFSNPIVDHGIRFPEIVRPGVQFKSPSDAVSESQDNDDSREEEEEKEEEEEEGGFGKSRDGDRIVDLQFFIKGLELGQRDAASLFFLVSFLSAAYGWVILGFTSLYSLMLGIVFVTVVNDFLGRFSSFVGVVWDGSRLGLKRLTGFILMRWAVRDALTQLVGLWYFGEIDDQYSFFKLFVRLKLMPFSIMSPWIRGFEKEISGFLFAWFLLDSFVAFIFAVDAWVTIVDSRRTGREILKEGCYLISTMVNQAVQIKCFEAVLCGSAVRWFLTRFLGRSLAAFLQSTMEVYFMVAWLIFYLAAKGKEAQAEGRRFERRELEGLVDGLR